MRNPKGSRICLGIRTIFILTLLSILIVMMPHTSASESQQFLIGGDVNEDGTINIIDALLIAQATIRLTPLTQIQLSEADVNKDGKVDITDSLFIAQYTVGLRQIFQNWVTKEHNFEHTGISNSVDVLTPTIEWKKSGVVGTYDEWGGVIVVDGIIYTVPMTTEKNMYAIYSHNQSIKCSKNIGQTNSPATYYNHIIYIHNVAGNLFALNEDCSEKWIRKVTTSQNSGAISISKENNAIFVSQGTPLRLYSYDLNTGNKNWDIPLSWDITFGIVYNNGLIYISGCCSSNLKSNLAAYYSNNGTLLWERIISGDVWDSDLLLWNNVLYTSTYYSDTDNIFAINLDGTIKWKQKIGGHSTPTTPKIYNNILWMVSSNISTMLYGINPYTGSIIYNGLRLDSDDNSDNSYTSIILGQNQFYFTTTGGSHNKLYAFSYSGNKVWSYDFGNTKLFSQGVLVNGELYITADDTTLYVFKG